ncbi:MAG: TonB family protein [Dysgonamonadaceae bacterium]|jgi:protein TonB|nr:TonB family protein [Dysgonamonadaceae bacterium]
MMQKDINIDSREWCDMLFGERNQEYGAYSLRQSSSKRHVFALMTVLALVILIALLPKLYGVVQGLTTQDLGKMDETLVMIDVSPEAQIPEENIIRKEIAPPLPPLKTTVQFVVPEPVPDEEVMADDKFKTQDDVLATTGQISIADVVGTDDNGIDIADLKDHQAIVEATDDVIFTTGVVENMPLFPGGEEAMFKYLNDNIKYPAIAIESNIQGRVTCNFVVERDGSITDVQVVKGVDPLLDREAVRVIKSMPRWLPGKQQGQPVRVRFTLPVSFRLKNN